MANSVTSDESADGRGASRPEVIDAIRERILGGDLVPGQRLVEADLCALLNTSRGTVRVALMDLEHEGLIERIANRGARVRVVTLEEALQIAEVRLAIESLCVLRAAERITDEQIAELRAYRDELTRRADHNDVEGFAELTRAISQYYVRIADQPVAEEMLERLRARNTRHRFRLTYRPGRAQAALPFWQALIDAICVRDGMEAQACLRRHVENIVETMKALASQHTPFALAYPGR